MYTASKTLSSIETKKGSAELMKHAYAFDYQGNVSSWTAAGSTRSFSYDGMQRLKKEEQGTSSITYTYDPMGNRTSTVAGTPTSSYTYNTFNQLTASTAIPSYTYDNNGNMKAKTGYTYKYDGENRLVEVQNASNVVIGSFTYNERGLRVRKTEGNVTT